MEVDKRKGGCVKVVLKVRHSRLSIAARNIQQRWLAACSAQRNCIQSWQTSRHTRLCRRVLSYFFLICSDSPQAPSQITSRIFPLYSCCYSPLHRIYSTSRYILFNFLLLHVSRFRSAIFSRHWARGYFRLSKDALPVREFAVASVASILSGFGVVALFCSVGVYV